MPLIGPTGDASDYTATREAIPCRLRTCERCAWVDAGGACITPHLTLIILYRESLHV